MPKIIANLEDTIIEQANIQLFEKGYSDMTMRSVAEACGIAVGTVYNYYKSKDMMVAKIMLRDWNH
ncbi:MAG: helix-turn-helix transcriptional regulator, partial [Clostridia bacterium]|nr:helix-turn-helix transcriptional regulator [Clostridia bacterium]